MSEDPTSVRADIWLWAARFFKTRGLARAAIKAGRVELNGHACKPGKAVCAGDGLQLTRGIERFQLEVLAVTQRRGPAREACLLYHELEASVAARLQARQRRRLSGWTAPPQRPDTRARRDLRRLKHSDPD